MMASSSSGVLRTASRAVRVGLIASAVALLRAAVGIGVLCMTPLSVVVSLRLIWLVFAVGSLVCACGSFVSSWDVFGFYPHD
jgi:hypothetical protein